MKSISNVKNSFALCFFRPSALVFPATFACSLFLFFAAGVFAQTPSPAPRSTPPPGTPAKPFVLPPTIDFKLPNGIAVTFAPYGNTPKTAVSIVVSTGAIDETADKTGLAGLLGAMLKEGTTNRSAEQIAEEMSGMGGALAVNTAEDQTTIGAEVLSERAAELVRLLADIAQNPLLPESELPRLKADILRNTSIARTQSGALAIERFRQILYPNHPYGRVFSPEDTINNFTAEDLRRFHRANFGAARTRIYVAGRFDVAAVRRAVTQAFGKMPTGKSASENPPAKIVFDKRRVALVNRPGAVQTTLFVGLPAVDPTDKDYIAYVVTNALLGGSFGSRITANIREQKGYTYSPFSQLSTRRRDAYWVEIADVTTNVTGASLKEIFYEIERLGKTAPPNDELDGIKNYLVGIFILQNSSRSGVINQLAFADLHGLDRNYLKNYVRQILAVTPAEVRRVAETHLRSDRMTIVAVGDAEKIRDQLSEFGALAP